MLTILLQQILSFDAIIDLGSGTFQVGRLDASGKGNLVEAVLNSQAKRQTPTLIAYDGERFYVGEFAEQFSKNNPDPVFRFFATQPGQKSSVFAFNPESPLIQNIKDEKALLLISSLVQHIVNAMINTRDQLNVAFIYPPTFGPAQIETFKQIFEQLNATLVSVVPSSVAVAITHLNSRTKSFNKVKGAQYVVADIGATSTDISVIRATYNSQKKAYYVALKNNQHIAVGGSNISFCLIDAFLPKDDFEHKAARRRLEAIEKAKKDLSADVEARINIEGYFVNGSNLKLKITRDQLDQCVDSIFNNEEVRSILSRSKRYLSDQMEFEGIFYGGTSRVVKLQKVFEIFYQQPFLKTVNLDEGAIFGGGLVMAQHNPKIRLQNNFVSLDLTSPKVSYKKKELFLPSSFVEYAFSGEFPAYENESYRHQVDTFDVEVLQFINSSQKIETETIKYRKPSSENVTPVLFQVYRDLDQQEVLYELQCVPQAQSLNISQLKLKYIPKHDDLKIIRQARMQDFKKEVREHNKRVDDFVNAMRDNLLKKGKTPKLIINFTADEQNVPVAYNSSVIIQLETNKTQTFALDTLCKVVFNESLLLPRAEFDRASDILKEALKAQNTQKEYEAQQNLLETLLHNRTTFQQTYQSSGQNSGDFLLYENETQLLNIWFDKLQVFHKRHEGDKPCSSIKCSQERLTLINGVLFPEKEIYDDVFARETRQHCRNQTDLDYGRRLRSLQQLVNNTEEYVANQAENIAEAQLKCTELHKIATLENLHQRLFKFFENFGNYNASKYATRVIPENIADYAQTCSEFQQQVKVTRQRLSETQIKIEEFQDFGKEIEAELSFRSKIGCDQVKKMDDKLGDLRNELAVESKDLRNAMSNISYQKFYTRQLEIVGQCKKKVDLVQRVLDGSGFSEVRDEIRQLYKVNAEDRQKALFTHFSAMQKLRPENICLDDEKIKIVDPSDKEKTENKTKKEL